MFLIIDVYEIRWPKNVVRIPKQLKKFKSDLLFMIYGIRVFMHMGNCKDNITQGIILTITKGKITLDIQVIISNKHYVTIDINKAC